MCDFENCFFLKKSKYHVCVILSRLCDTLNVMDGQVSRRRDSITQTWYFDFFRKKQFSELFIVEEMYEQAGAVLGQAQLKLEMDFTSINLHQIDEI